MMRVSSTYLVRVDRNRYIIPAGFAGKAVFIRITADQVRMVADGEIIAAQQHIHAALGAATGLRPLALLISTRKEA